MTWQPKVGDVAALRVRIDAVKRVGDTAWRWEVHPTGWAPHVVLSTSAGDPTLAPFLSAADQAALLAVVRAAIMDAHIMDGRYHAADKPDCRICAALKRLPAHLRERAEAEGGS